MAKHLKALREQLPKAAWQPDAAHRWSFLDLDEESDPYHVEINRRRPFQQANAEQNEAMRQWIANELVICDRSSSVLELFSGSGNFTEVLVQLGFKSILASEVGTQAMAELAQKQWTGVRTQRLNLYHPLAIAEVLRLASDTQIVLANPPRAGLLHMNRLLPKLRHLQTILYISCDPVSFASDARRIIKNGFELKKVQALDQMPQTPHVEILGRFDRVLNS
ncbi:MAG: hypothetical protein NTX25_21890 [Proteobacteria bacterium]|nr:hypothetical protein [Pseudomonadota bacterium]